MGLIARDSNQTPSASGRSAGTRPDERDSFGWHRCRALTGEESRHAAGCRIQGAPGLPEAHWLIVGDGPQREDLETLAVSRGVADRVHFLGTRGDTERILAALDLFTLSSLNEASPVSILEALACGVPVVSTDVGSVRESILEGETGQLVPSGDSEAMRGAVESLLKSPEKRRRMGVAGREHVCQTGSLDSMVRGYQELLTHLYDVQTQRQIAACNRPRISQSEEVIRLR